MFQSPKDTCKIKISETTVITAGVTDDGFLGFSFEESVDAWGPSLHHSQDIPHRTIMGVITPREVPS